MKKEELLELARLLGINPDAMENGLKINKKETEESIIKVATFMGLK